MVSYIVAEEDSPVRSEFGNCNSYDCTQRRERGHVQSGNGGLATNRPDSRYRTCPVRHCTVKANGECLERRWTQTRRRENYWALSGAVNLLWPSKPHRRRENKESEGELNPFRYLCVRLLQKAVSRWRHWQRRAVTAKARDDVRSEVTAQRSDDTMMTCC